MYVLYIKIMSIFFFETKVKYVMGLPWWLSSTESACKCRRCRFNPWVRKIPWRRRWQPTVVFLPGKSHGQRSRAGYSPWGCKKLDTTTKARYTDSFVSFLTSIFVTIAKYFIGIFVHLKLLKISLVWDIQTISNLMS